MIPKYLNPSKPLVKINGKWLPLLSQGNGEYTAGNKKFKTNTKPKSALGTKLIIVTPKSTRIENIKKKSERKYTSAFKGNDIIYPLKKGFEVIGKGLYNFGQGIERAASQVSPYGSIRPTNSNWSASSTPVTDATFLYVLPTLAPSRWVGTLRERKAPWNPTNTGLGDEDTNLLFDVGVSGPFMKGVSKVSKASAKTGKAIGQTAANTVDYISKKL